MAISLGLNIPYVEGSMDGATPRWTDILAMATAGEAAGFDTLWISDHLGFGDPAGVWSGAWESMTLLSALAATVPRVRLGTYVTAMPLRNPALLAKMAETLDEVSGGRLILGLGAGWNEPEFTAFGVPFDHRFDRFEDGLRIIAAMFRDGHADLDGDWSRARHAPIAPRGPRPSGPPIMIGTSGPRMLRLRVERRHAAARRAAAADRQGRRRVPGRGSRSRDAAAVGRSADPDDRRDRRPAARGT
jgi:alkanesulfonate monooxygenase SsuD/methylene tetrahydromethanopterin reductase-like flavin-dependent oxidoreductase (luciferase family)